MQEDVGQKSITIPLAQAALGHRNGIRPVEQVFQPGQSSSSHGLVTRAVVWGGLVPPSCTVSHRISSQNHHIQIMPTSDSKLHTIVSQIFQASVIVGLQHIALQTSCSTSTERLIGSFSIHSLGVLMTLRLVVLHLILAPNILLLRKSMLKEEETKGMSFTCAEITETFQYPSMHFSSHSM